MYDGNTNLEAAVVVVDGDPAVRHALKFSLEVEGFAVFTYANGHELLQSSVPDQGCLVVDYNLPGMNGLDLLIELRSREVEIPAILIATQPSPSVRRKAFNAGYRIIEKPLLGDALVACIREIFDGQVM